MQHQNFCPTGAVSVYIPQTVLALRGSYLFTVIGWGCGVFGWWAPGGRLVGAWCWLGLWGFRLVGAWWAPGGRLVLAGAVGFSAGGRLVGAWWAPGVGWRFRVFGWWAPGGR